MHLDLEWTGRESHSVEQRADMAVGPAIAHVIRRPAGRVEGDRVAARRRRGESAVLARSVAELERDRTRRTVRDQRAFVGYPLGPMAYYIVSATRA